MAKYKMLIVHTIIFIYSVIIATFNNLGDSYYEYIYALSLYNITNHAIDMIVFVSICSFVIAFYDFISVVIAFEEVIKKRKLLRSLVFEVIMMIIASVSFVLLFGNYVVFIT